MKIFPWVLLTEFKLSCLLIGCILSTSEVEDKQTFACYSLHWSCLVTVSGSQAHIRLESLDLHSDFSVHSSASATIEDCGLQDDMQ